MTRQQITTALRESQLDSRVDFNSDKPSVDAVEFGSRYRILLTARSVAPHEARHANQEQQQGPRLWN